MMFTLFAAATTATGAQLDSNFSEVANMATFPCGVTGTNVLALTPLSADPSISAYTNYQTFQGVAAATNTGGVTAGVGTLATLNVYKDTASGPVALTGSEIVIGNAFVLTYDSSLNAGAGGFHLATGIATASGTFLPLAGGTLSGPLWGTSVAVTGAATVGTSLSVGGLASAASVAISGNITGASLTIGAGNTVRKVLSSIASVVFTSVAANASQDQIVSFVGANINDTVMMGLPSIAVTGVAYNAFVATSGSVVLRAINGTASGVTPTGGSVRLTLMQF